MKEVLTQERLKDLLHYDPETGEWTWRVANSNAIKVGDIAGGIDKYGYRRIKVDWKIYQSSRLAFLYKEGYFPENEVDHKNRIKDDDRWKNLRHVSSQCNARNRGVFSSNNSGVTGVHFEKLKKLWRARIMVSGKEIGLGRSKSFIKAVKRRWEAEKKYNFPNCNTTSSAYLYLQNERIA